MELIGKAKVDFEHWYRNIFEKKEAEGKPCLYENEDTNPHYPWTFYTLPNSMKFGVYEEWFDSTGIAIVGLPYQLIINEGSIQRHKTDFGGFNRIEGRELAIENANEIYNET